MTGDRPDRSATDGPGAESTPGSWVSDLRDLERRDDDFSPSTRLRALAARRTAKQSRPAPDGDVSRDVGRTATDNPTDRSTPSPLIAGIRRAAAVEDLTPVGSADQRRYGRAVDARVTADGGRYDLEVRLFRPPESDGFATALADQIDRWVGLSDLDGIVPAVDGSEDPRPWLLAAPVTATLADRSPNPSDAVEQAHTLARTVASLHRRGAVHAGIDPRHVVYPAKSDRPHLDNVGLVDVYRRYTDPATVLDPRYAPPEYFDDRYGVVDRTTDVYALGAVCYRLLTGQPPYEGSPAEIRDAVLTDPLPRPSTQAAVPEAVDTVVRTATATDKFDRYGSATAFAEALRDACATER